MKKWLFLFFILTGCQGSQDKFSMDAVSGELNPIVGGEEVSIADDVAQKVLSMQALFNPVVVTVGSSTKTSYNVFQCTASAIGPRLVLTAAHCLAKSTDIHRVEIATQQGRRFIEAAKVVPHPEYHGDNKVPDLALVLLKEDLPVDVKILRLPEAYIDLGLSTIQAAGFGRTNGLKSLPAGDVKLRKTHLDVVSYSPEEPTFTVDQTQGRGVCQGDSGGPAIVNLGGHDVVVGVVSQSLFLLDTDPNQERDTCNYKGLYVNVQFYLNWIHDTAKTLASQ